MCRPRAGRWVRVTLTNIRRCPAGCSVLLLDGGDNHLAPGPDGPAAQGPHIVETVRVVVGSDIGEDRAEARNIAQGDMDPNPGAGDLSSLFDGPDGLSGLRRRAYGDVGDNFLAVGFRVCNAHLLSFRWASLPFCLGVVARGRVGSTSGLPDFRREARWNHLPTSCGSKGGFTIPCACTITSAFHVRR